MRSRTLGRHAAVHQRELYKNFFLESSFRNKAFIQLPAARRVLCITIVSLSPLLWVCAGEKPKICLNKFLRVEHLLSTHPSFGHQTNLLFIHDQVMDKDIYCRQNWQSRTKASKNKGISLSD